MVRTVLALLLVTLLAPSLAADAAVTAYGANQGCRAVGVPIDLPDCRASQDGQATLLGCDAATCTLAIEVSSAATGLLPGEQAIEAAVLADERTVLCGTVAVSPFPGSASCSGAREVVVAVPGACRLIVVATTATADKAVSANAFSELRVCRDGTVTTP